MDVSERVPIEILKRRVPNAPWDNLMGSGVRLDDRSGRKLLNIWATRLDREPVVYPDEVDEFYEGSATTVRVDRYERNPKHVLHAKLTLEPSVGSAVSRVRRSSVQMVGGSFTYITFVRNLPQEVPR